MVSWYIESSRTYEKYLKQVNVVVAPCMDFFCNRLCEIELYDMNDIKRIFKEIIEELPILNLTKVGDEFIIIYNSYTSIRFNNGITGIRREIVLNNILK